MPIIATRGSTSARAYGWGAAESIPEGAYELISSTAPSYTRTFSFSSIPSTYKHLEVRLLGTDDGLQTYCSMYFNGDTSGNYAYHGLLGYSPTSKSFQGNNGTGFMQIGGAATSIGGQNPSAWVITILDYANTSKFKVMRDYFGNGNQSSNVGSAGVSSGLWKNTSAINSITFDVGSGNRWREYTYAALYGIKG